MWCGLLGFGAHVAVCLHKRCTKSELLGIFSPPTILRNTMRFPLPHNRFFCMLPCMLWMYLCTKASLSLTSDTRFILFPRMSPSSCHPAFA
ncbi:hypothetical protein BDZ45DRAFT_426278 [Acephala macrosclerotiorum]|nr:hypothetical protein BDZ45DRAFT_426278 [Acephala macrosclerotiorum]